MPKKKMSREDTLALLTDKINTALGDDGKVYLGRDVAQELERIPTGVLAFDTITGGGLPRRRLTELYGAESAGKTTLALHIVAAVQRSGGVAVWIVGEEWDDDWAVANGVDIDALIKIEAITGDKMLETAITYMESGLIDLVVVDSWQSIGTAREIMAGVEKESYAGAGAPQLYARFYRACISLYNSGKSRAAIVGISQVRSQIGGFSPNGAPEPLPAQIWVLKHWKSISIQCKRGEPTFEDPKSEKKRIISREFHLKCKKNKTAPPERVSSYVYNFRGDNVGIDAMEEIVRLGKVYGVLEQRGKYLQGFGLKASGGDGVPATEAFKTLLRKRPKLVRKIRRLIIAAANEG